MARTICPECGSADLTFTLVALPNDHAPLDGQLRMHDVHAALVQGCEECSATVAMYDDDREVDRLLSHRTINIIVRT